MCLNNKKILVTGGLGFIGRSLLEKLIETQCGAKLYAIDIKDIPENAKILKFAIFKKPGLQNRASSVCHIHFLFCHVRVTHKIVYKFNRTLKTLL